MIREANLVGVDETNRAQVYLDYATRRRGMFETGVRIYSNITNSWLKINVTQTTEEEGARWHFLHLLDRLQQQGWTLKTGYVDTDTTVDYADYLDQAMQTWNNVGRS